MLASHELRGRLEEAPLHDSFISTNDDSASRIQTGSHHSRCIPPPTSYQHTTKWRFDVSEARDNCNALIGHQAML